MGIHKNFLDSVLSSTASKLVPTIPR